MHHDNYWQRWSRKQVNRRRVLIGVALSGAGLMAAPLAGCGEEKKPAATMPATEPKRGGIIARQGGTGNMQDTEGRSFDPQVEGPPLGRNMRLVYQALLGYDLVSYEVQPDLAQSWEQPSQREYIFKLASGAKWHNKPPANGRQLIGEDVVFSLNRARTNEPRFLHRSLLDAVDRIEAVDQATVRVIASRPDATTLAAFGSDNLIILNPEVVARADRFSTPEEVVGSGAFIMKDVQERVAGEYVRNPGYFKPDLPYLDSIRTPHFSEPQTGYAAFQAGKVDIGRVPGSQVKEYLSRQAPGFTPYWFNLDFVYWLMPQTEKKPFDDPRVTRALRLLADHHEFMTAFAEVTLGRGSFASIFPAALKAWEVPEEEFKRRIFWQQPKEAAIREALALLSAAGFERANPLKFELVTFDSASVRPGAEMLQAQFRQNSQGIVQTELRPYDLPTQRRVQVQGTFEYGYWPNDGAIMEPGVWLNQLWRSGGSRNYWRLRDARLDSMIDRQNVTFNIEERKALIKEIILYMMDNSPGIASTGLSSLNAVSPKIRSFSPEGFLNGRQYQGIWLAT